MRAPRIVEEMRYLPITLLDNPDDLEVARMVTLRAIARDAVDLGKDMLAEAFERERMHAPQHFPITFLNLLHSVPVHRGSASVTREAAACVGVLDVRVSGPSASTPPIISASPGVPRPGALR